MLAGGRRDGHRIQKLDLHRHLVQEDESMRAVIGLGPKPDENTWGVLVDATHACYVLRFFGEIHSG